MNIFKATTRLMYEDARWFFCKLILLYITLPFFIFWVMIGTLVEPQNTMASISGPIYFFVPFYAAIGYKSMLPIGIGLGSTRKIILKSFYVIGITFTIFTVSILNVMQFVLATLYEKGISSANILHVGRLITNEYNFFRFLWIDLMIFVFLFGIVFIFTCITYRFGMVRIFTAIMLVSLITMTFYYLNFLDLPIQWISELNIKAMQIVTGLGITGLLFLAITYPLMSNVSIEKKATRF